MILGSENFFSYSNLHNISTSHSLLKSVCSYQQQILITNLHPMRRKLGIFIELRHLGGFEHLRCLKIATSMGLRRFKNLCCNVFEIAMLVER
jgi:hypothetical protein